MRVTARLEPAPYMLPFVGCASQDGVRPEDGPVRTLYGSPRPPARITPILADWRSYCIRVGPCTMVHGDSLRCRVYSSRGSCRVNGSASLRWLEWHIRTPPNPSTTSAT